MHALTVLMWKHWTVRRRSSIQTPLELGLTLIFFGILFGARSAFVDKPNDASKGNTNKARRNIFNTTMMHYHINETMQYSVLFQQLEQLRDEFPDLIEDYSVTETTLEEVFLSFAHDAAEPAPASKV